MSQNRNIKWLNDRRIVYRRDPDTDVPTTETKQYKYYADGTYQCYHLFNSKAKITTYKSLKWHMLVLYYLNIDGVEGDEISLEDDMRYLFKFIANKENGFVTFFIKQKILNDMIEDVFNQGGDPPANKLRKVVFKPYSGLDLSGKLKIVGQLIGRPSIDKYDIYDAMVEVDGKITISKIAKLLSCSTRTVHRHMSDDLKREKQILNEKL
jgi:phage antirepressor YoqD-like protein